MIFETENFEFKSQITEELYKTIVAFANTDGGIIYVGVDNNGNVVGLAVTDNMDIVDLVLSIGTRLDDAGV